MHSWRSGVDGDTGMTDGFIRSIWSAIDDALLWTPEWLVGLAVLGIPALAAAVLDRIAVMPFPGGFGGRNPGPRGNPRQIKGPPALAVLAFPLPAAPPSAPLNPRSRR